jgi:hypothetical protein
MRRVVRSGFALALAVCPVLLSLLTASSLHAQQRQALQTQVAAPAGAKLIGRLPGSQRLRLAISLPLRNQDQLDNLLRQLYDPASPNYRHFLTVEQFTEQFGPSVGDYQRVIGFAQSHGLKVVRSFPNRLALSVSGSVANIEQAFQVTMQVYEHPTENRTFSAPDVEPTVESGVPVLSVDGLSTYNLPHSMLKRATPNEGVHSNQTGSGPGGQFLGSDMRTAYGGGTALDGSGQAIGLIELGPYRLTDVLDYFSTLSQTLSVPIVNVLLDADGICAGSPPFGCDDGEEVVDIQQAISMAPNASALIVYEAYGSGIDALAAYTQAATDNIAKQMSMSFLWGGNPGSEPGYEQVFQKLAAQGQSSFVASGDTGASIPSPGNSGALYPGNSQYITGAGGTDLTTNGAGGAWQSEMGWVGSEGGWNNESPIPSWQSPVINSSNGGGSSYRNIPDVAAEANLDNYFCANGACGGGAGGTSLAAPRWAGVVALINQQVAANATAAGSNSTIGFLNPTIYTVGQGSSYGSAFHDITTGSNPCSSSPGCPGSFSAVTGYDLVTGWGTPNGPSIFGALAPISTNPNFSMSATPGILNLTPGNGGTSSIAVSALQGFNAATNLTVTIPDSPTGVTASLSASSIPAGGGPVTLTVSTTSATPGGTYVAAITGKTSGGLTQTVYVTLALPWFELTTAPAAGVSVNQGGSAAGIIAVDGFNGFNGSVNLAASGLPGGVTATVTSTGSTTNTATFSASSTAMLTGAGSPYSATVSATSPGVAAQRDAIALFVNPATTGGSGTEVDLSSAYNVYGFYTDADQAAITGPNSLDGVGYAYSANLLNSGLDFNGAQFTFGPANQPDAVYGTGTAIPLPAGTYATLQMLATGIEGPQKSQTVTVTYTDNTTSQFTQSFSDWCSGLNGGGCTSPGGYSGESVAVAMPYRDSSGGSDNGVFYLYHYSFALSTNKTVQSLTLPTNRDVVALAATLAGPVTTGFTLSPAPSTLSVPQGGNNTSTITVNPTGGFTGSVNLAASGLPGGVTASFNPNPATTTSALTLTASGTATTGGPTAVIITGTSGSLTPTTMIDVTVTPPASYSLSARTATPASINPGSTSQATVTVASANGYTGTVTLSCSVTSTVTFTPAQAACSFGSTSPVTVTSNGGTATVTFSTVSSSATMFRRSGPLYALLLPIPGLALIALGLGARGSRRNRLLGLLLLWMMLVVLLILPACSGSSGGGGGGGGTPAGTYTVTITGKDANGMAQTGAVAAATVTVH